MRIALLLALLLLSSCGRPLTPGEKSFASQTHGHTLDTDRIRMINGALVGKVTYKRQKRPRLACRERIFPEPTGEFVTVGPAAITLHNRIFYAKPFYLNDYLESYPNRLPLLEAMLFAHKITHVWQWQNRHQTGYSPLRAAGEHTPGEDPYLFDISTQNKFLDYAFEQQASIVEEYVCCAALDPSAPRTKRLETLLKGAFPMTKLTIPDAVKTPWKDAQTTGICH